MKEINDKGEIMNKPKPKNEWELIGWAGQYGKTEVTDNGKTYFQSDIAVPDGKDEKGDWKNAYIRFKLWGEEAMKAPDSGDTIRITGRPKVNSWTTRDGVAKSSLEVQVFQMEILAKGDTYSKGNGLVEEAKTAHRASTPDVDATPDPF